MVNKKLSYYRYNTGQAFKLSFSFFLHHWLNMHLLLIEDDLPLGSALIRLLKSSYRVEWVRSLSDAKNYLLAQDYDLILLDLGLPDGDGITFLQSIRQNSNTTPVLILTARDSLDDKVLGLDMGADDYMVKPFEPDELLARLRAQLRRLAGQASQLIISGNLTLDPVQNRFCLDECPIRLPKKEHEILSVLIHAGAQPVSRSKLMQQLYSLGSEAESNTLDVYIHALRKILGKERIETIRGYGFRLKEPSDEKEPLDEKEY